MSTRSSRWKAIRLSTYVVRQQSLVTALHFVVTDLLLAWRAGNYMPEMDFGSRFGLGDDDDDNEGEDEEDDDDDMLRQWMLPYGAEDEEDDEDYDEDEEGDDLDDDSDEEPRPMLRKATKKGGVVIQELDDDEDEEDEEMEERGQAPHSAGKTKPGVHEADYIPLGGAAAAAASAGKKRPAQDSQAAPPQKKATAGSTPPASQKSRPESKQQEAPASGAKPGSHFNDGPPGSLGSRKFTNGLEVINLVNGKPDGKVALPGKRVSMKYVGRLKANGKVFDATKGAPFSFRLGVGEVIKGWDIGVKNMRVGDKRRLIIPPDLGYGSKGAPGAIPPNAWLEFDVELVGVH